MRTYWFILIFGFYTLPVSSQTVSTIQMGFGRASCATWLSSPVNEAEGSAWVLGWWSGRNLSNALNDQNGEIGQSTDALGVLGTVKQSCLAQPAVSLSEIVNQLYLEFQQNDR